MQQRLRISKELNGLVWRYGNTAAANRRHTHAELELNLVMRGAGTYLLGNRRYTIRRGDLIWLFPAQEHVLFEQTTDFAMWIAVFRRKAVLHTATAPDSRALLQPLLPVEACRRLTPEDLRGISALLAELAATRNRPDILNAGLGYLLLQAWQGFERAAEVSVLDVHPAVERAARLLRDNPESRSLDTIARRAGLSPARLSRLFKAQTGFGFAEFRNRQRFEHFVAIYGTGHRRSMLDSALEAGFGSYAQFHRIFRRLTGSSPRDYRRGVS